MYTTLKLSAPLRIGVWGGAGGARCGVTIHVQRILTQLDAPLLRLHHAFSLPKNQVIIPKALQIKFSNRYRHKSTMSQHQIPEKQWAQVIEKTGGPVDYKEIPGKTRFLVSERATS